MFRLILSRGVSAGAMTLALASGAVAQTTLPPIFIDVDRLRPRTESLATPVNESVVTEEKIQEERPAVADTAQLLRDTPGVSLYEGSGVARLPAIHGLADDRLKILLGGVNVTSACANHMNPPLSYIDPGQVGRIEVLAGITPVSKGGDSIGGTIIVDPRPPLFASPALAPVAPGGLVPPPFWPLPAPGALRFGPDGAVLATGYVSAFYRTNNHGISISGAANVATEHWSLLYNGAYTRGTDYHEGDNGPKVLSTAFISENHSATLAYQNEGHLFTLRGTYQNIPYQAWPNVRMDMAGIAGRGPGNRAFSVDAGYLGAFAWGTVDAKAFWRHTAHIMEFLADKQPNRMPMFTSASDFGYSIKTEIPFAEISGRDILRIGNEFHGYTLNDWWEPVPGSMMMGPRTYWNINGGERYRVGTFAEWEALWTPQWSSLLGVRNDTVWMDTGAAHPYNPNLPPVVIMPGPIPNSGVRDALLFNSVGHARTDVNFDVTALVRYHPDEFSWYEAGYSRKTRSPNLYERYAWNYGVSSDMVGWFGDANGYVGNLNLSPEVAHTFSVTGAWRDTVNGNWEAKLTPYLTYVENFIDVDKVGQWTEYNSPMRKAYYVPPGVTFPVLQFRNHNALLYGVDFSGRLKLAEAPEFGRFDFSSIISYVYGENLDTHDGLYFIMPLNARFALEHRLGGWSSAVELQLVDNKTHVAAVRNEFKTPDYALIHLRSSYEWSNLRFDVGIENVADTRYFPPLGGFYFSGYLRSGLNHARYGTPLAVGPVPGIGRTFYGGVTVKF